MTLAIESPRFAVPPAPARIPAVRVAKDRTAVGSLAVGGAIAAVGALPLQRPTFAGNIGPGDLVVLVGVLASAMALTIARRPVKLPFVWPVALTSVSGLLAGLAGAYPSDALLAVIQDLFLLVWAIVLANLVSVPNVARAIVRGWCVTASIWSVVMFGLMGRDLLAAGSAAGRVSITADTNGAGLYFVMSMFVICAARWPRSVAVRSVVLVLLFLDTLMTGSLGALSGLALGIAAALVVGVASKRGPAPAVALLLAIAMGVSSGVLIAERYQIMTAAHKSHNSLLKNSLGREAQSSGERRNLTIETTELAGSTPLFGRGPSSTESVLRAEQAPYVKQAHDDWIAAYIERGVLGVLALLLLVAAIAHYAWRAMRARAPDGAAERGLPAPQYLIGGLALVLVFSFTHEVLHDRVAWTLFGLLAGIQLVTQVQLPNLRRG